MKRIHRPARVALAATAIGLAVLSLSAAAMADAVSTDGPLLTGWARLPAATFADGPTSGQFAGANPYGTHLPPYPSLQPVQGFSAVLAGPRRNTVTVMTDNGFGTQGNSADTLLRTYDLRIDWHSRQGGSGTVQPVTRGLGLPRPGFDARTRITLNDHLHRLTVPLQADLPTYYGDPANPPVDPAIVQGRLLTGADFDIESVRRDHLGRLWFGDEFGPYLIRTDAHGTVQRAEIPLPGVYAPQHRDVLAGTAVANLPSSGGFEGMAINPGGTRLYTLLEKTVAGDPAGTLRINEFDVDAEAYTSAWWVYPLDAEGTAIGDMTAVDDTRFIVIERNGGTATNGTVPFKKLFLIDIAGVAAGGTVAKTELVDLMAIADPDDLDGDGSTTFTFPYVTIEDVLILDSRTLLVINDNNFPYGGGRALEADDTEFLRIRLPAPLTAR